MGETKHSPFEEGILTNRRRRYDKEAIGKAREKKGAWGLIKSLGKVTEDELNGVMMGDAKDYDKEYMTEAMEEAQTDDKEFEEKRDQEFVEGLEGVSSLEEALDYSRNATVRLLRTSEQNTHNIPGFESKIQEEAFRKKMDELVGGIDEKSRSGLFEDIKNKYTSIFLYLSDEIKRYSTQERDVVAHTEAVKMKKELYGLINGLRTVRDKLLPDRSAEFQKRISDSEDLMSLSRVVLELGDHAYLPYGSMEFEVFIEEDDDVKFHEKMNELIEVLKQSNPNRSSGELSKDFCKEFDQEFGFDRFKVNDVIIPDKELATPEERQEKIDEFSSNDKKHFVRGIINKNI